MYDINFFNGSFIVKTADKDSIYKFYDIYKNTEVFKYATGILQNPLEFKAYVNEIKRFLFKENSFLLEIELNGSGESLGMIKGFIVENEKIAWVNSFAINTPFQSRGYGRMVIDSVQNHFKQKYLINRIYLSVSTNNIAGINFWKKCGYTNCEYIPKTNLQLDTHVRIMWKML